MKKGKTESRFEGWDSALRQVRCAPSLLLLGVSLLPAPLYSSAAVAGTVTLFEQALRESELLAGAGAWRLSLAVLNRHRPDYREFPIHWLRWARRRVAVQELAGDHVGVIRGLKELPPDLSVEAQLWAAEHAAQANLRLGKGREARRQLSKLFWLGAAKQERRRMTGWRRLVIESYLGDGLIADAHTAALRYQLDYGDSGREWRQLQARVALTNDNPKHVLELLKEPKNSMEVVLRLSARVRTGGMSEKELLRAVGSIHRDDKALEATKRDAWVVVFEYAQAHGKALLAVESLERALIFAPDQAGEHADALWAGYERFAVSAANKKHLLIGAFKDWFDLARRQEASSPGARALFAYLTLHAANTSVGGQSASEFVRQLQRMDGGLKVMDALFLYGGGYQNRESIPAAARHLLVDRSLARGELALASELLGSLETPPSGVGNFDWQLRRARVLVLSGKKKAGAAVLRELLNAVKRLSAGDADRFNQVVFDLQSADGHDLAFGLFALAVDKAPNKKYVREALFWMADSLSAEKEYAQAAQLYLKSAMLPGAKVMDRWALAARYQAAEALAEADLIEDARNVYRSLLTVTEDPSRRASLTRAIRKLRTRHERPH